VDKAQGFITMKLTCRALRRQRLKGRNRRLNYTRKIQQRCKRSMCSVGLGDSPTDNMLEAGAILIRQRVLFWVNEDLFLDEDPRVIAELIYSTMVKARLTVHSSSADNKDVISL